MTRQGMFSNSGKWLTTLVLGSASLAAHAADNSTIPQLSCKTPVTVFNTGTDASGNPLPIGSQDTKWNYNFRHQLVGQPPISTDPQPNNDPGWKSTVRFEDAAWVNPSGANTGFSEAKWVSPYAEDAPTTPGMNHTRVRGSANYDYGYANPYINLYRFQFTLAPEVNPSHFQFDLNYFADDYMRGVYVNSTTLMQGIPAGQFDTTPPPHITLTAAWQPSNTNTIIFSVGDGGWSAGMLARVVPGTQSFCTQVPIVVTKSSDKSSYGANEAIQYTVTAENMGAVDVPGNTLADPIPSGVQNPQWSCSSSLATGSSCPATPIASPISFALKTGEKLTFTLNGTTGTSGTLSNTATLTPGTGAECAANTGCAASVNPTLTPPAPAPNLTPVWPANTPNALTVGTPTSFTLNVNNTGAAATTNGTLTVTLPANVAFTGTPPAGCTVAGQVMSCSLPAIAANNGSTSITFSAMASAAIANGTIDAVISNVTGETLTTDNNASTPISAKTNTGGGDGGTGTAQPVPALAPWSLAILALVMGLGGWLHRRRVHRQS